MKKLLFILFVGILICHRSFGQKAPRMQWHDVVETSISGTIYKHWCYSMIPTTLKTYIGAGYGFINVGQLPLIEGLNKFGQTQWAKPISSLLSSSGSFVSVNSGVFYQVIEKSVGVYLAVGKVNVPSYGDCVAIVEFTEDGTINNSVRQLFEAPPGFTGKYFGYSIAIDPTPNHSSYWITGRFVGTKSGVSERSMFVSRIDLPLSSNSVTTISYNGQDSGSAGEKILTQLDATDPNGYKVYACGYISASTSGSPVFDGKRITGNNSMGTPVLLTAFDKDIFLTKLNSNVTTASSYPQAYNKTMLPSIHFNETGPLSARTGNPFNQLSSSPVALANLEESVNVDERGSDMIFGLDGNIELVGIVNVVAPIGGGDPYSAGNGGDILRNSGTSPSGHIDDVQRHLQYDEYLDADGYILKIDPASGSLISGGGTRNIGHFSGENWRAAITQNMCGEYIVAASSADYFPSSNFDHDIRTPAKTDALIVGAVDGNSTYPYERWRRTVRSVDDDALCAFSVNATADGGFVVAGNNCINGDQMSAYKFAPPDAVENNFDVSYAFNGAAFHDVVTGTENWTNNNLNGNAYTYPGIVKINSLVVVRAGATLNINNCHLQFAASDHMFDYWDFNNIQNYTGGTQIGIIVEPGGKLNITNNSILEGITNCDRYMWDGIVIQGDPNNPLQNPTTQGSLILNKATIKDARVAAAIDNCFRFSVTNPSIPITNINSTNYSSRYYLTASMGGGIVDMQNSLEQDCRFGITYWDYHYSPGSPGYFLNNDFKQTAAGMGDPIFYAREEDGGRGGCVTMLAVYGVSGVQVLDNRFWCDPSYPRKYHGYGIIGNDGAINITSGTTGNSFTSLGTAISYNFMFYTSPALNITNNFFDDNQQGVAVSGSANNTLIYQNDFRVPTIPYPGTGPHYPGIGVNLAGCHGYSVTENKINYCPGCSNGGYVPQGDMGIVVNNAHDLDDVIEANTIGAIDMPATALQQNGNDVMNPSGFPWTGLLWKCNDFKAYDLYAILRVSTDITNPSTPIPATMRALQGECGSAYSALANNRFFNLCGLSGNERLYEDASVTQNVDYPYYNDPLSFPELNPQITCTGPQYTLSTCFIPGPTFDYSTACVPAPPQLRPSEIKKQLDATFSQSTNKNAKQTGGPLSSKQSLLIADLARSYGRSGDYSTAASMLESYGLYSEALPFYCQARRWDDAFRVLELLPTVTKAEQQYRQIMKIGLPIFSTDHNWKSISAEDRAIVNSIAEQSVPSPAVYMARGIVTKLDETNFRWPIPAKPELTALAGRNTSNGKELGAAKNVRAEFSIHPNPTTGNFSVQAGAGVLDVYDVKGVKVASYEIKEAKSSFTLPETLSAGVYIGQYQSADGKTSRTTRIIYQP